MSDDWRVVYESQVRQACLDRALVLTAVSIPHSLIEDESGFALLVPAAQSGQAVEELRLYDQENPPGFVRPPAPIDDLNPVPGIVAYLAIIVGVAWLDAWSLWDFNWRSAGRMDGVLLRDGEVWRAITSLTLHVDLEHLAGNIIFGSLFGLFAGRYVGYGVAWLAILVAAAVGNSVNTLLLEESHKSIGASTAVFAALGLAAGYAWRSRAFRGSHWTARYGPIVGGFALLMFTGTGDENTDIGAHLMGFLAGLLSGVLISQSTLPLRDDAMQRRAAWLALALVATSWVFALTAV